MPKENAKRLSLLACLAAAAGVQAHGLMESPPSRNWICGNATRPNETDAGTAKTPACAEAFKVDKIAGYSFMSVVTHTWGRAKVTPLPKNVCSFDSETWKGAVTPWDVPMDWPAQPMKAGPLKITWDITTGPHFDDTRDFSYWITKPTFVFSPTKPLTWDDFEAEPFCVQLYKDSDPSFNPKITTDKSKSRITSECDIPERSGHHVIYGEWGRTEPTIERFHGCIDAAFGSLAGLLPISRERLKPAAAPQKATDALGRKAKPAVRMHFEVPAAP
jgi:chitin-binding protein